MKKTIAEKWVENLRSGKYKQTKGRLNKDGAWCCLGVLCEMSGKDYDPRNGSVPKEIMKWSGLKDSLGSVWRKKETEPFALYLLNDTEGLTFDEIADVIQICWREL